MPIAGKGHQTVFGTYLNISADDRTRMKGLNTMRKPTKQTLGDLLVQSLTELRDGLRGQPGKLTMKTVEIPDPPHFSASAVHKLRDRLGLSQGLFGKLLGVSRKLVEAWESSSRTPSPMACRLLEAIARKPSIYVKRRHRAA
jgi:DNA-binding transcriptional regulator YiaG